ncbi:MAG: HAD family phosphatase [Acidobacteria bacterium]|nr:HAD family phosphatase [Acidobacteriota bacterium]MCA1649776.1 HAD family phosphatase [Acidobacteriota bacterium]
MSHAIVFDFDGVLADSEPLHLRAYQNVFESLGTTLTSEEYYTHYLGFDDQDVFRAAGSAKGLLFDTRQLEALIEDKSRVLEGLVAAGGVLYPGASECIARMASAFPLGIASGSLRHEIEAVLRREGVDRYFRFIVGSGDTRQSKPAPDPYIRAAELHGLPPAACVAIEDSRWGIESAKAAGMWCVGITHSYPRHELAAADVVIDKLAEITPGLIRSLLHS